MLDVSPDPPGQGNFFHQTNNARKALAKYFRPTDTELGTGAFGKVYLYKSVDTSIEDEFAVKKIDKSVVAAD